MTNEDIKWASEVSKFMESLYDIDQVRYNQALLNSMPHGDLAYGAALNDWNKNGRPKSIFSYADGEIECPLLMSFRQEISEKFGLPILTRDEARIWRASQSVIKDHKVFDWGPN